MNNKLVQAAAFAMLVTGASACARLHARVDPPLDPPPPPPRVVLPIESPPAPAEAKPSPPPQRAPANPAPAKPERAEAPAQPAAPAPRTLTTANAAAAEQRTRTLIANATRDLGRIDYRALGADARAQYDTAKRFIEQAESALKVKNVGFAEQLADKAATLAVLLQQR